MALLSSADSRAALRRMAVEDRAGILLYLAQEGQHQLPRPANFRAAYTLQDQGLDTLDANRACFIDGAR